MTSFSFYTSWDKVTTDISICGKYVIVQLKEKKNVRYIDIFDIFQMR